MQSVKAAINVLAHKAAINGYKSAEIEVRVAPGQSWSSIMPKEQTLAQINTWLVKRYRAYADSLVSLPTATE